MVFINNQQILKKSKIFEKNSCIFGKPVVLYIGSQE